MNRGFDEQQLSEEVVRAKSEFERRLEQAGRLQNWATENTDKLTQLTGEQFRAVQQQARVLEAIGRRIAAAVEQEQRRR